MHESFVPYRVAADYLSKQLEKNGIPFPVVGVICGSGLSGLSKTLDGKTLTVPYAEIPQFPSKTTVHGHSGELVFGMLSGVPAICFRGRFHTYEGHDPKVRRRQRMSCFLCIVGVRVLKSNRVARFLFGSYL